MNNHNVAYQVEDNVENHFHENKLPKVQKEGVCENKHYVVQKQLNDQKLVPQTDVKSKLSHSSHQVIPLSNHTYGKIVFKDSVQNHVGTKIVAQNLTIINPSREKTVDKTSLFGEDQNNNIKVRSFKRFFTRRIKLVIIGIILAMFLIAIVTVSIAYLSDKSDNKPSTKPTSIPTTVTTENTPPTTEIWPTDSPPDDWFYSYTQWSGDDPLTPCDNFYNSAAKSTLVIDSTDSEPCYDLEHCISLLQTEEGVNQKFHFNYVMGGDGRVYEELGNNCSPESGWDHNAIIKVAFIGDYHSDNNNTYLSNFQKNAFKNLQNKILQSRQLSESYVIYPQCCRNTTTPGPGRLIINYLNGELKPLYHPCLNVDKLCN